MAVFGALGRALAAASPWAMVTGVLIGSALWWLILAAGVGWLRERFDARWQRAVNLASAALLGGLWLWQLGQLVPEREGRRPVASSSPTCRRDWRFGCDDRPTVARARGGDPLKSAPALHASEVL